eukprot:144609-Rhodomonas_salina.1
MFVVCRCTTWIGQIGACRFRLSTLVSGHRCCRWEQLQASTLGARRFSSHFSTFLLARYDPICFLSATILLCRGDDGESYSVLRGSRTSDVLAMRIAVWEGSTELEFLLSFTLPSTAPGIFEIVIQPKTCSEQCGFGVRFNFRMIDSSLPVLLPPLPSSGALQLTAMLSPIFVSNVDTASLLGVFASYTSTETGVTTSVGAVQWTIDPTRSTVIRLPAVPHPAVANAFGEYTVTLMVSESGINKTVALEHYLLADGTATRVVSFNPSIAPASTTAYGNPVDLRSEINVVLANFVQSLTPQDVRVLFDGEEVEDVLDVEDLAQCSGAVDCERTRIIFKAPPVVSPGKVQVSIAQRSQASVPHVFELEYTPTCAWESYCSSLRPSQIVDFKQLEETPNIDCDE